MHFLFTISFSFPFFSACFLIIFFLHSNQIHEKRATSANLNSTTPSIYDLENGRKKSVSRFGILCEFPYSTLFTKLVKFVKSFVFMVGLPFHIVFFITIPRPRRSGSCTCQVKDSYYNVVKSGHYDSNKNHHRIQHPVYRCIHWKVVVLMSFIFSIVWLGTLTFIIVDIAEYVMRCQGYDAAWTGLTVLAIGSSLPDCFSSIAVAREGKMDMAISNAFGSNIFDIFFCLGVPFFLQAIVSGKPIPVPEVEMFSWLSEFSLIAIIIVTVSFPPPLSLPVCLCLSMYCCCCRRRC